MNIDSGYIFPSKHVMDDYMKMSREERSQWEIDDESFIMSYESYQKKFKELCKKALARDDNFGSHSNRKTAYLLGTWAGAEKSDTMLAARHKTIKNANTYLVRMHPHCWK